MTQSIQDVMTMDPITVPASATLDEAALQMRERDIGDVLVTEDGEVRGVVTDRDIVVRAVADGKDPTATRVGEICTSNLVALTLQDSVEDAVRLMSERAIRRIPVIDGGRAVGVVSIGDLAIERDPDSTLADISTAPANQ